MAKQLIKGYYVSVSKINNYPTDLIFKKVHIFTVFTKT